MTVRTFAPTVVALALLLGAMVGCTSDDGGTADGAATTTSPTTADGAAAPGGEDEEWVTVATDPEAAFVEGECWWDTDQVDPEVTVTCGTVEVPEDWSDPDGEDRVVLAVARLHHSGSDAEAAPVVVLHGGPGGASLTNAPVNRSNGPIVAERDVILWDQRGSGRSLPSLNCPEQEQAVVEALATDAPFAQELATNLAAAEACRDRLLDEGIDLNQFHIAASVNDLEALRVAFDLDGWNVSGTSYGTRLGLSYAREHPDRVRGLLLDSVYPIHVGGLERVQDLPQDAFDRLFAECAADADCAAAYPDLAGLLDEAEASLDADPAELTQRITLEGEEREQEFRIVGPDFRSGMFAAMYDNDLMGLIPSLIAGVAGGSRGVLPTFIDTAIPRLTDQSEGAYYSVDCADSGRTLQGATAEEIGRDGQDSLYLLILAHTYCDVWGVDFLPAAYNEPALPDVPTLITSGTLDPVTPHQDSVDQAAAMPDARLVVVPRGGHGVQSFDDCTTDAVVGFFDDPGADLPSCADSIEPPPFATP